jgi:hypothetical protein
MGYPMVGCLDRGVQTMKDTDKKGWSIGSRSHTATRLGRCNIVELIGGLRGTWCVMMNVCGAITL